MGVLFDDKTFVLLIKLNALKDLLQHSEMQLFVFIGVQMEVNLVLSGEI